MTTERAILAGGCFWGMQDLIRKQPGVASTRVGYTGGTVKNATYRNHEGHAEAIEITFDPAKTSYEEILKLFWENHDPTQGMRQGNDVGTQYRSAIYWTTDAQRAAAERSRDTYAERLRGAGYPEVTTEIARASQFFYAEDYHQQYLHKVPNGYCGLGGTGVSCPVGLGAAADA